MAALMVSIRLIVGNFLAHDLSVTYERLLAWSAWWIPLVEQDLIYHLDLLCPTSVLMGFLLPVPSQGHYGFDSFPVVDWFCLFI
jgi:hypothetical protein